MTTRYHYLSTPDAHLDRKVTKVEDISKMSLQSVDDSTRLACEQLTKQRVLQYVKLHDACWRIESRSNQKSDNSMFSIISVPLYF